MRGRLLTLLAALLSVSAAQEPGGASVTVLAATEQYRLIEHVLGRTEVPRNPERIVSLSFVLTDDLLALGVKPVASETYENDFAYLGPRAQGVTPIPVKGERYSLEAVLAAQPDLILTGAYGGELYAASYEQLSQIAPTVVMNETDAYVADRWILDLGVVLGVEEEAAARLAAYQEKLAKARAALQKSVGNEKVGLFRITARDFRVYGNVGYTALLYDQGLNLTPPDLARELAWGAYNKSVSLEVLPQLADAEHLFVSVDGDEDAARVFEELRQNPLWQRLPAVRAGNVYPVERRTWMTNGILAGEHKLEDVLDVLMEKR